ncbi:MAG: phytanoyl-CoA dioxygenase family protein [Burkholderiaceae bacterium]
MSHHLSAQEISFFRDNGYLVIPQLVTTDSVSQMDSAINRIISGGDPIAKVAELEPTDSSVLRRIWSPSKKDPVFRAVQEDPRILDRLEGMIGPDIVFHHSKLNMKGPRVGSAVEWHQDMSYYPHTNSKLVACLIYLDEATEENGCLHVLRGSHASRQVFDHTENGFFRGRVSVQNLPSGVEEVSLPGEPGTGIFLHCKLLHRSAPNRSNRQRRCFIPAYRAADSLPIYFGPHAAHNEPDAYLLRGRKSMTVTSEAAEYPLPIAEKPFNSLFAIQQGEHVALSDLHTSSSGYATKESGTALR